MKIKQGFLLREVADNYIVVAVGSAVKDFNGIITLNESAAYLWKQLEEDLNEDQLVSRLLSEYEVTEEQAKIDVKKFIDKLKDAKLVE